MGHLPDIKHVQAGIEGAIDVPSFAHADDAVAAKHKFSLTQHQPTEIDDADFARRLSTPDGWTTRRVNSTRTPPTALSDFPDGEVHDVEQSSGRRSKRPRSHSPQQSPRMHDGDDKCFRVNRRPAGSSAFALVDFPGTAERSQRPSPPHIHRDAHATPISPPMPPQMPRRQNAMGNRGRPGLPGGASAYGARKSSGSRIRNSGSLSPAPPAQPSTGSFRRASLGIEGCRKSNPADRFPARPASSGGIGFAVGAKPLLQRGSSPPEREVYSAHEGGEPMVKKGTFDVDGDDIAEALRKAFIDKCGSLDAAFKWVDYTYTGRLTRTEWGYALKQLEQPDFLRLLPSGKLFALISKGGEIDLETWQAFFQYQSSMDALATSSLLNRRLSRERHHGECDIPHAVHRSADDSQIESEMRSRRISASKLQRFSQAQSSDQGSGSKRKMQKSNSVEELESRAPMVPSLQSVLDPLADDGYGVAGELTRKHRAAAAEVTEQQQAEAELLEEEIEELNLKGVQALAYILCNKLGSLDKAYKWLDYNSRGNFARVQWETGVKLLHIDLMKVTGVEAKKFFFAMDRKHKGQISKKNWDRFFAENMDGDFTKVLEGLEKKKPIWQRAAPKLKAIMRRPRGRHKKNDADDRGEDKIKRGVSEASTMTADGSPRVADLGATSRSTGSRPTSVSASRTRKNTKDGKDGTDSNNSTSKSMAISKSLGTPDHSPDSSKSKDSSKLGQSKSSSDRDIRPNSSHGNRHASNRNAEKDAATDESPEAFLQRTRERLSKLRPDEGVEFPKIGRAQRRIVEELIAELGYWSTKTGEGGHTLLVINEGTEAARIQSELAGLKSGQCWRYSGPSLTASLRGPPWQWWHYSRAVAENMGLWVSPVEASAEKDEDLPLDFEVWNLGGSIEDFANSVRDMLSRLQSGDVRGFPSTLSMPQIGVIEDIAAEMGFYCKILADGIHVGNLDAFEKKVRLELELLAEGDSHEYIASAAKDRDLWDLSPLAMDLVHKIVDELQESLALTSATSSDKEGRTILTISKDKAGGVRETDNPAEEVKSNVHLDTDSIKQKVEVLFKSYATGKKGSNNVFLRKPDLDRFAHDAFSSHNEKSRMDLLSILDELESIYDDILQLQIDIGTRVGHGLVLDYFQVFLSKAAGVFGWSLISLLFVLLEKA